jgi:hypothetical protein
MLRPSAGLSHDQGEKDATINPYGNQNPGEDEVAPIQEQHEDSSTPEPIPHTPAKALRSSCAAWSDGIIRSLERWQTHDTATSFHRRGVSEHAPSSPAVDEEVLGAIRHGPASP